MQHSHNLLETTPISGTGEIPPPMERENSPPVFTEEIYSTSSDSQEPQQTSSPVEEGEQSSTRQWTLNLVQNYLRVRQIEPELEHYLREAFRRERFPETGQASASRMSPDVAEFIPESVKTDEWWESFVASHPARDWWSEFATDHLLHDLSPERSEDVQQAIGDTAAHTDTKQTKSHFDEDAYQALLKKGPKDGDDTLYVYDFIGILTNQFLISRSFVQTARRVADADTFHAHKFSKEIKEEGQALEKRYKGREDWANDAARIEEKATQVIQARGERYEEMREWARKMFPKWLEKSFVEWKQAQLVEGKSPEHYADLIRQQQQRQERVQTLQRQQAEVYHQQVQDLQRLTDLRWQVEEELLWAAMLHQQVQRSWESRSWLQRLWQAGRRLWQG